MCFIQMPQRDRRGPVDPLFEGEGAEVAMQWPPPPQNPTPLGEAAHKDGGGRCRPVGPSGGGCGGGDACRRHLRGRSAAVIPTQSSIWYRGYYYYCRHYYRRHRLRGLQGEVGRPARAGRGERA